MVRTLVADRPLTPLVLVGANLIPLAGVLFWGWSLFAVLALFWVESAVVGFFNILRIALARQFPKEMQDNLEAAAVSVPAKAALGMLKLFLIPFFIVHYGMFMMGHAVFLVAFFLTDGSGTAGLGNALAEPTMLIAIGSLFVSHGISFVTNYIGLGEYKTASPQQLMAQPYKRIFVMHLAIIFGAFFVTAVGSSLAVLVILIVLKIGIDLVSHVREHKPVSV